MGKKKLRVFHGLVNYGTQAGLFAKGLRDLGVDARSYTGNDPFNRPTDYQFKQRKGVLSKLFFYWFWYPLIRLTCFFRFDIFHFYYGTTLNAKQWDLPFYKLFGKKVVMHYLGNDIELYQWSIDNYEITNMQYLFTPEAGLKHDLKVEKRRAFEKKYIDKALVCAPQYAPFVKDVEVLELALKVGDIKFIEPRAYETGDVLKVIHAPSNRLKKGTKFLVDAVEKLNKEGFKVDLEICEGISHGDLLMKYEACHVSVIALLGGWYGTAGIEAMASGRPIITFIRDEFIDMMSIKKEEMPIISANRDTIYEELKKVALNHYNLEKLSMESRKYVIAHHDLKNLTKRLFNIYNSI